MVDSQYLKGNVSNFLHQNILQVLNGIPPWCQQVAVRKFILIVATTIIFPGITKQPRIGAGKAVIFLHVESEDESSFKIHSLMQHYLTSGHSTFKYV